MVSYNFKTINYYIKLTATSIALNEDYDCEEKNPESKTSDEKKDKKDFSDFDFFIKSHEFLVIYKLSFRQQSKLTYSSIDYSLGVYSPPDLILN